MLQDIDEPQEPYSSSTVWGMPMPPIDRLGAFSDGEFENMVLEWAYSYLSEKYKKVRRIGGAGDMGRDIIAYINDEGTKIDIYQCKHYNNALAPSDMWTEFGKLCYYTYKNEYLVPENYIIVTAKEIGPKLNKYLENPSTINQTLIDKWQKYCEKSITKTADVKMTNKLEDYIKKFDFSIIKSLPPLEFIDQHSKTKWYKYRFGGGIPKRPPNPTPPAGISTEEQQMEYVKQLVNVYNEEDDAIKDIESLRSNHMYFTHFIRQRKSYFMAQALKRFSRDEFIGEPYEEAKEEICAAVIDTSLEDYEKDINRVNATLREARKIPLEGNELGKINPSDKSGMCHELVNETRLKWVNKNE